MSFVVKNSSQEILGLIWLNEDFGSIELKTESKVFHSLNYIIDKDYRQQGIAIQAIKFVLLYTFTVLGWESLYAFVHVGKDASKNLLTKLGFITLPYTRQAKTIHVLKKTGVST